MKDIPKIIMRGKITYVLYPDKVVVGVGLGQWVSYNQYDNWNRQGITTFRNRILKSKENEYDNPTEQMDLAMQCSIVGTGTTKPKDIE
jgi:hypothetical protein